MSEIERQKTKPLDKFGEFLVRHLRDKSLEYLQLMLEGRLRQPERQSLQSTVSSLTPDLKVAVCELVEDLLTNAMHDILFAFQEAHDNQTGIEIFVDGAPIAELSDGLHGEIFGEEGWIVRFSKFPSNTEVARSRWAEEQIKRMFGGSGTL
ncbi:MAG: hypothetical protein NUV77_24975 [Thermoguttaceae bacterium]|jgi:hypothetical protein|nr:hypothetical protein [Thermoguttaceae bacterium]